MIPLSILFKIVYSVLFQIFHYYIITFIILVDEDKLSVISIYDKESSYNYQPQEYKKHFKIDYSWTVKRNVEHILLVSF